MTSSAWHDHMKAIILTEGGRKKGFGHMTRCLAIAQGMQRYGRSKVKFIIDGDDSVKYILRGFDFTIADWKKKHEELNDAVISSDAAIVDSYLAPPSFYSLLTSRRRPSRPYTVAIDDYKRIDYAADMLINPSIYGEEVAYSSGRHRRSEALCLLGKDYIILRKEFWKVPKKIIKKDVTDVLVTFGGGNHAHFAARLLKFLLRRYPGLTYHVVGMLKGAIPGRVRYYPNLSARGMLRLMLGCDMAISGGGQTTYELARLGVPMMGICFAENQRLNLEGWRNIGFAEYVESGDNALVRIKELMDNMLARKMRRERSVIGRLAVDGKGVKRIVNRIRENL